MLSSQLKVNIIQQLPVYDELQSLYLHSSIECIQAQPPQNNLFPSPSFSLSLFLFQIPLSLSFPPLYLFLSQFFDLAQTQTHNQPRKIDQGKEACFQQLNHCTQKKKLSKHKNIGRAFEHHHTLAVVIQTPKTQSSTASVQSEAWTVFRSIRNPRTRLEEYLANRLCLKSVSSKVTGELGITEVMNTQTGSLKSYRSNVFHTMVHIPPAKCQHVILLLFVKEHCQLERSKWVWLQNTKTHQTLHVLQYHISKPCKAKS